MTEETRLNAVDKKTILYVGTSVAAAVLIECADIAFFKGAYFAYVLLAFVLLSIAIVCHVTYNSAKVKEDAE